MRHTYKREFVDAGVDWITVTAREPEKVDRMRSFAYGLIETELGIGNFGRPWYQSGYVGVACGHVQFGDRADGCILRLGSHVAKNYWMRILEFSDNVTRLDVQCTVRSEERPAVVVHKHYREIQRSRRKFKRAPRLSRICDDDGGYTVYSGRRCSNVMGRIYDKESESKLDHLQNCVRYEVQFNGKRARWVAQVLNSKSYDLVDVARTVLEFFRDRGCSLRSLFELLTLSVSIDTSQPAESKTDLTRKLEWLLHSVRPSVRHLVTLGFRARVLGVLGLLDVPDGPQFSSA